MKIAFIGQKGIPAKYGGIERHVESLAVQLAENRANKVFVYNRPWFVSKKRKKQKKVNLISIPSIHTKHLDAISHTLFSSIHALFQDFDIIHYHGVGPALLSWIPRLFKPKSKVFVTFHCIDRKHQKWGLLARLALRLGEYAALLFAHKTIVVSQVLEEYCDAVYDSDATYIPNGIFKKDIKYIKKSEMKSTLGKYGLESGEYFVMLSRLIRHKGAHHLIKAYNQLETNKKLVIIGGSAFTDDYVKEIKELAKNNKNIIFTGFQSGKSLDILMSQAFMVVHPSESEGLPIAVLEAMAYGKFTLVSDIPENTEAVSMYGITFKNKNVDSLVQKMKEVLAINPENIKDLGAKSREYVHKYYNWADIVEKTQQEYHNELEKPYMVQNLAKKA